MEWELIERAKEELEIVETDHPHKFEGLKMELRDFITDLQLQLNTNINMTYAATQESSNKRKRRKEGSSMNKRRCKTDDVLEKARQCLSKIQHLKTKLMLF